MDVKKLRNEALMVAGDIGQSTVRARLVATQLVRILDAAERGLTAMAWTVNGPEVEKPEGSVLLWRGDVQAAVMGEWAGDEWHTDDTDAYGDVRRCGDGEITHFMAIKEPTDV